MRVNVNFVEPVIDDIGSLNELALEGQLEIIRDVGGDLPARA